MFLLLTACSSPVPQTDAVATIEENLEQLAALEVFEVGALINSAREEASNCYGLCAGHEDEIAEEEERQAVRLDRLVEVASDVRSAYGDAETCTDEAIAANLDALAALRIVEVGTLIEVVPDNNPNCYNLPCEEDIEVAEMQTCDRAGALDRTVRGTAGI